MGGKKSGQWGRGSWKVTPQKGVGLWVKEKDLPDKMEGGCQQL